MDIHTVAAVIILMYRQMDMMKLIGVFYYHVNAPKNTDIITINLMRTIVH